jgi:hypothetical protein
MIPVKLKQNFFFSPSITSWLNLSMKTLGMLALIPLVNTTFSELDRFFWFVLATTWSLVLLLDVGLNATITRYFSYLNATDNLSAIIPCDLPLSSDDIKLLTKLISKFYYGAMLVVVLLVFPVIFFSIYEKLNGSPKFFEYVYLMLATSGVSLLYLFSNAFNGINQGLGLLPKVQLMQFLATAVSVVLASTAIYTTQSLSVTVVCFYAPFTLYFFLIRRTALLALSRRFTNGENSNFYKVKKMILARMLRDTLKSGLGIFASQGFIIGSTMIVNKIETIEVALVYMICMQIIRAICSFSQVPFYSSIPLFCSQYAKKQYNKLAVGLTQKFSISIFLFIAIVVCVGLLSQTDLGGIIFGNQLELTIWMAFGCTFLVERIGAILIQLYTVTGQIRWHIVNTGGGLISLTIIILMPVNLNAYTILGSIFLSYLFFVIPYISFYIAKEPNLNVPKLVIS